MAQDKMKSLYDTFVNDGYEMEAEAEFRKNMEDGKKRRAAYDALVNDGYDMEPFEEFEKNIGVAAAETKPAAAETKPAAAKTMSAEESMGFLMGMPDLTSGVRHGKETVARMGRQADYATKGGQFGFGGVMRTEPKVNTETMQAEQRYVDSQGNEFADETAARETARVTREAADLETLEGQLRHAYQELEGIRANKEQRGEAVNGTGKLTDEEKRIGVLGGGMSRVGNERIDSEYNRWAAAERKAKERIKSLEREKDRRAGKDIGFWRGVTDNTTLDKYDFGVTAVADAGAARSAIDSPNDASSRALLEQYAAAESAAEYDKQNGLWYGGGQVLADMLPFMKDFMLSGGMTSAIRVGANGATKMAARAIGEEAMKKIAEKGTLAFVREGGKKAAAQAAERFAIKAMGATVDDMLKGAAIAGTTQALSTTAKVMDEKTGGVVMDGKTGTLRFEDKKSWGEALWQAGADQVIENASEMFGTHIDSFISKAGKKALGYITPKAVTEALTRVSGDAAGEVVGRMDKLCGYTDALLRKAEVGGIIGEGIEEYDGQVWRTLLGLDSAYTTDENGEKVNVLGTADYHKQMWSGLALSMGAMKAFGYGATGTIMAAGKGVDMAQYYRLKHSLEGLDADARALWSNGVGEWERVRELIDSTPNEGMPAMANTALNNKGYTEEQRGAIMDYMERTLQMRGFNLASQAKLREANDATMPVYERMNNGYAAGYGVESAEDRADTAGVLDIRAEELRGAANGTISEGGEMEWLEAVGMGNPAKAVERLREEGHTAAADAASAYLEAYRAMQGAMQRAKDNAENRVRENDMVIRQRTNKGTGMVVAATMVDGRAVDIVSGSVKTDERGIVLYPESDETLIVRDRATGKTEMVSPRLVVTAEQPVDAEEMRTKEAEAIRGAEEYESRRQFGGRLGFMAGEKVTIGYAQDGTPVTGTVNGLAADGDGVVNGDLVSVTDTAGNVLTLRTDALQQIATYENMERARRKAQGADENNARNVGENGENNVPLPSDNNNINNGTENQGNQGADSSQTGGAGDATLEAGRGENIQPATDNEGAAAQRGAGRPEGEASPFARKRLEDRRNKQYTDGQHAYGADFAIAGYYEAADGRHVATYNDHNGEVGLILSANSDNQYVALFRIYDESGKPTGEWTANMSNDKSQADSKEAFRRMISAVMAQLPEGAIFTEKTSVSVDGLRVLLQQTKHGFDFARDANGEIRTREVAVNDGNADEKFPELVVTDDNFAAVRDYLARELVKYGLPASLIRRDGSRMYISLPVLQKKAEERSQPSDATDGGTAPDYSNVGVGDELSLRGEGGVVGAVVDEVYRDADGNVEGVLLSMDAPLIEGGATQGYLPIADLAEMDANGNNVQENIPEAAEDAQPAVTTMRDRMPHGEDGTIQWGSMDVDADTNFDALVEEMGGNAEDAAEFARLQAERSKAATEQKRKAADKLVRDHKAMAIETPQDFKAAKDAERAAAEEYEQAKAQQKHWEDIATVRQRRAEAAQRAADIAAHDKAVAELAEQKRIEAEKKAEQERVGTHAVNPKIKAKWDAAPKAVGAAHTMILPDGTRLNGHYVLTVAGAATPSHDASNAFAPSEGYPVNESGHSVNDRDYERDMDARNMARTMAESYDGRALQNVPTVSEGVVIDGNNRTISGEIAAKNGTDAQYVADLKAAPGQFGVTTEQIAEMEKHGSPRMTFVLDEPLPYTTETFARFNAQSTKTQSGTETAVKMGKLVSDQTFGRIASSLAHFDRLSDFYGDKKASVAAVMELMHQGVVNEMDAPALFEGDGLSGRGQDLLENVLVGKVFEGNPEAVRSLTNNRAMRQAVVMAMAEIAHNRTLGGYALTDELSKAVELVARAKAADADLYKVGMPVSPFGRQLGLFDDEYGESAVTDATVLLLADILNSSKPGDLRKVLASYNGEAAQAAAGQADIFSGEIKSKEQLLKEVNEHYINATAKEQQAIVDAAIADRKRRAAEAAGETGTTEEGGGQGESNRPNAAEGVQQPTGVGENPRRGSVRLSEEEAEELVANMESNAEMSTEVALTAESWSAVFDENNSIMTPLGRVKMGGNQITKFFDKNRTKEFGMVAPTLGDPDVIVSEPSTSANGKPERGSSYLFIKTFNRNGEKIKFYASITVQQDGMEVSVSSHYVSPNKVRTTLKENDVLYIKDALFSNSSERRLAEHQNDVPDLLPTQENNASTETSEGLQASASKPDEPATDASGGKVTETSGVSQDIDVKLSELGETSSAEEVQAARDGMNTDPTEGQKKAGNYKKGHIKVDGYDVTIENPKGSVRSGRDAGGTEWSIEMKHDYGYIRGIKGVDGDEIDVYLSDTPTEGNVYVVDQVDQGTGEFDEHKVMYGFGSMEEAVQAYRDQYEDGWKVGIVTEVSREEFKKWIKSSNRKTKPFADYARVKPLSAQSGDVDKTTGNDRGTTEKFDEQAENVENTSEKNDGNEENVVPLQQEDNKQEDNKQEDDEQGEVVRLPGEGKAVDTLYAANSADGRRGGGSGEASSLGGRTSKSALLGDVVRRNTQTEGVGAWIEDIGTIADERLDGGAESVVYLSKDGKSVVKVNDFSFLPDDSENFESFINRLESFNELFPSDAVRVLGFTRNEDGRVCIVFEQPLVHAVREATEDEIDSFLEDMDFYTDISGEWTDGRYVIGDLKPANVLVDENGVLHFVDVLTYDSERKGKMLKAVRRETAVLYEIENSDVPAFEQSQRAAAELAVDLVRQSGIEVSMDEKEMADALGEGAQMQARLNNLAKAAMAIKDWFTNKKEGKTFELELPKATLDYVKKAIRRANYQKEIPLDGLKFRLTSDGLKHGKKNHGVNGKKIEPNHIPLRDEDFELAPYIMTRPDNVEIVTSLDNNPNRLPSILFKKTLSNGVVVVVERQIENDPHIAETTNMWADLSSTNVPDARFKRPLSHVQNVTISTEDIAKIRKDAENAIIRDGFLQKLTVYHGSGADFDAFDHSHMGEGEGAQAYGWGTYVTEVEGIGRTYAYSSAKDVYKSPKLQDAEHELFNLRTRLRELPEDIGNLASRHHEASTLLEREIKKGEQIKQENGETSIEYRNWAFLGEEAISDYKRDVERYQKLINERSEELEQLPQRIKDKEEAIKPLQTEYEEARKNRFLYTVDIPKNTGENYLSWDKRIDGKMLDKIADAYYGCMEPVLDKRAVELVNDGKISKADAVGISITNGKELYYHISRNTGGDEMASKFLREIGVVGIEYPAEYRSGGREDGAKNYVIFNEADAKIVDKTQFLRTRNGEVYGFVKDGKIYLDPKLLNPNTPVHEYTHIWDMALQKKNPELWKRGVELMKQTPLWEEVKNNPAYADIAGDDNLIASEVHARLTGKEGAALLEQMVEDTKTSSKGVLDMAEKVSAIAKLRQWVKEAWQWVRDTMTPWTKEETQGVSLEEFVKMPLKDLVDGKGGLRYRDGEEEDIRIKKLRDSEPARITGDEIEPSDDIKQYKKNALEYGKKLQGTYTNKDTGMEVQLQRGRKNGGINEVLQHDYKDVEHLQSIAAIPQIIENGIFIASEENQDKAKNPNVKEYQHYVCGLRIGSEDYTVRSVYAVDKDGNRYYDHKLTHVEKAKLLDLIDQATLENSFGATPGTKPTTDFGYKDKRLVSLLQGIAGKSTAEATNNTDLQGADSNLRFRVVDDAKEEDAGLDIDNVNDVFNKTLAEFNEANADKTVFDLGRPSEKLLSAGVGDMPMKLYGSKVMKKVRKHGFDPSELRNLPKAVANPIAVFNNYGSESNRSILTEMTTKDGNYLVTIEWGKGQDVDFNIVSSVFGKSGNSIVNWVNNGYLTYVDKEKALEYLHLSAPIAEASSNQELSSAAKVVKEFDNSKAESGEFKHSAENNTDLQGADSNIKSEKDYPQYDFSKNPRFAKADARKSLALQSVEYADAEASHGFANYKEARQWAKDNIAKTYSDTETNGKGEIRVSGAAIDKYLSEKAVNKSESKDVHLSVLKVLPDVLRKSVDVEQHEDRMKGADGVRDASNGINANVMIHRLYGAVRMDDGKVYRVKITVKEDRTNAEPQKAYSYEATKIELLAGLHGEAVTSPRYSNNSISLANLLENVDSDKNVGKKILGEDANSVNLQGADSKTESAKRAKVESLSATLHKPIRVAHSSEFKGRQAKAKGWYDTETGEIVVVLDNNKSVADVEMTVLHEAVGHYGLRELLGAEFDSFLDSVYENATVAVRRKIVALATKNGWDFRVATEEYLAGLAETTDFANASEQAWWGKVKKLFLDMLEKVGFANLSGVKLGDNELRYILWRSYKNLAEGGRRGILGEAEDVAKQAELGVGNYAESGSIRYMGSRVNKRMAEIAEGEKDSRFRFRDETDPIERVQVREDYDRLMRQSGYQAREALQDSMLSLRRLMEMVLEKNGRGEAADYENAYMAENLMSSRNFAEQEQYQKRLMRPLTEAVSELMKEGASYEEVTDYMMAKHGLERNVAMAARLAEEMAAKYNATHKSQKTAADFIDEARKRDFSGLTGMFGEKDTAVAEQLAQDMVDEFEANHDTNDLWVRTNACTKATLQKMRDSGVLSKEQHAEIAGMYQYYVPLRGWDEKTSDEVYGYLGGNDGPMRGSIMKRAEGRRTKADDPLATIAAMATKGISEGNRNLMKQRFLNFVLNNPSDAVSVSKLWLRHNDVTGEWEPVFPEIPSDTAPSDVEDIVKNFEERMEALAQAEPDNYKRGKDAQNIPYIVKRENVGEHRVLVKRRGETIVLTINGNPRAAQALNGMSNPNVNSDGLMKRLSESVQGLNQWLSGAYTTKNPGFVASNFIRDAIYSNVMAWVKESPAYAAKFNGNFVKLLVPGRMMGLLSKYENGGLDMSDKTERLFYQFMANGGETGYTQLRDVEQEKKLIAEELKQYGETIPLRKAWRALTAFLDSVNRSVENTARFAAFITSMGEGRSMERSAWDAKEISVNFNKKGAGSTYFGAEGQTRAGNAAAAVSGAGRGLYVFWNAALQGSTNTLRAAKHHKGKALALAASAFMLGMMVAAFAGDGDDGDDKKNYQYLPEHVRRSNICFNVGDKWVTIPLPVEMRAIYGMGELAASTMMHGEGVSKEETAFKMAEQMSQLMPLDMLEGGSASWMAFVPSWLKPVAEVAVNRDWTGLPIYKDTPYNKNSPEWTKAYGGTNKALVGAAKWLNEAGGGDAVKSGWKMTDFNPAMVEHLVEGYMGGYAQTVNQLMRLGETAVGEREFDTRDVPVASRVVRNADERALEMGVNERYYREKDNYDEQQRLKNGYMDQAKQGNEEYVEKLYELIGGEAYQDAVSKKGYYRAMDKLLKARKYATAEEKKEIDSLMMELKRMVVSEGSQQADKQ